MYMKDELRGLVGSAQRCRYLEVSIQWHKVITLPILPFDMNYASQSQSYQHGLMTGNHPNRSNVKSSLNVNLQKDATATTVMHDICQNPMTPPQSDLRHGSARGRRPHVWRDMEYRGANKVELW